MEDEEKQDYWFMTKRKKRERETAWNTIIKLKVPEIPRGIPSEKLP
jgi:hypothetical protein